MIEAHSVRPGLDLGNIRGVCSSLSTEKQSAAFLTVPSDSNDGSDPSSIPNVSHVIQELRLDLFASFSQYAFGDRQFDAETEEVALLRYGQLQC